MNLVRMRFWTIVATVCLLSTMLLPSESPRTDSSLSISLHGLAASRVLAEGPDVVYLPLTFSNFEMIWPNPYGMENRDDNLLHMGAQAGLRWVRVPLYWDDTEGLDDFYWWTPNDDRLQEIADQHMEPIVYIWKTPPWAVENPANDPYRCHAPKDVQKLADFLTDLVNRYKGPPYNVKYWEVYNEEDMRDFGMIGCLGDDAPAYTNMLKAAYQAIKAADPFAQVLIGGLTMVDPIGTNPNFLAEVIANGGGNSFDIVSFHFYEGQETASYTCADPPACTITGLAGKAKMVRDVLAQNNLQKPLMATEIAGRCFPENQPCDQASLERQSDLVIKYNVRGMALELKALIWYTLNYPGFYNSSLLDEQGQPKPAFRTYQTLSAELSNVRFVRASDFGTSGIEGYVFQIDASPQEAWVLWNTATGTKHVNFSVAELGHDGMRAVDKYGVERQLTDNNDDGVPGDGQITLAVAESPLIVNP